VRRELTVNKPSDNRRLPGVRRANQNDLGLHPVIDLASNLAEKVARSKLWPVVCRFKASFQAFLITMRT
jgi:hypothetical protein